MKDGRVRSLMPCALLGHDGWLCPSRVLLLDQSATSKVKCVSAAASLPIGATCASCPKEWPAGLCRRFQCLEYSIGWRERVWAAVTNAGEGGQWAEPSIAFLPHTGAWPPPGDLPSILAREQELLHWLETPSILHHRAEHLESKKAARKLFYVEWHHPAHWAALVSYEMDLILPGNLYYEKN